ncbi:unnamed protein product [Tilletia laevis]|uniref:Uncharacterized protein n=3 Tax=Tilletia TaxID=13289 RepID=A0A8X7MRC7_9BASI|nr:hypothetical protein CF336_g4158 [Tilletia laevis]KAE8196316.1 hypothetical protein CF328_g4173 [Tilletia controversa]KAE8260549.1 hypothetical protein A4X03_0g3801 [Tilletia caries]KAE8202682.1 hypothetical protein CF335_g3322 [Tilletia laevis]KAE8246589.1 hypothetical protein A4X06_0g4957 [Tilletia controversa]
MAAPSALAAAPVETPSSSKAGSLSAQILKRAKAVHKKLQRISAYETQDKAALNADQVRAVASKPTLEAVYAELNSILAQTQQHEAAAHSQSDAEVERLTRLANANAERADDAHAQLSFLLQFLHLYSLFNNDSTTNATTPQPDVPTALAATITAADIHALNPVLYAFANAPLFGIAPDDSETALGIIKRIKEADPSEIVFSAGVPSPSSASSSLIQAGITHARLAELVNALTAAPPIPTQFGAIDSAENDSEPVPPLGPSAGANADLAPTSDDDAPIAMPVPHLPPATDSASAAPDSAEAPSYINIDADKGFSSGSGPVPPSAGGRILFMQASEVEGETEFEPEPISEQAPADEPGQDTATSSAPTSMPVPEFAEAGEPEGGAVDGAPPAEDVPAPQPDTAASESLPLADEPAAPRETAPAPPKKIDWASLDDDDDDAIHEEVLRSSVLSLGAGHEREAGKTVEFAPAAAEAESTPLTKQVGKTRTAQTGGNASPSSNGPRSVRGPGRSSDAVAAPVPAPLRKPEPVVDEDGFVLHTTKKTLRQQQLAAQQESQQQNRRAGGARVGGAGPRPGRGGGGGSGGPGAGGRNPRREGSSGVAVEGQEGLTDGAPNGHGRDRSSGGGGAAGGARSGSGPGAGRGAGAAPGLPGSQNGQGSRGRGRGRPSNAGGRQGSASAALAPSTPTA